jgi:hypothetical protein
VTGATSGTPPPGFLDKSAGVKEREEVSLIYEKRKSAAMHENKGREKTGRTAKSVAL